MVIDFGDRHRLLGRRGGDFLAQHRPQGIEKLPLADWLGHIFVHPAGQTPLAVALQSVGRHGDDRHVLAGLPFSVVPWHNRSRQGNMRWS